MKTDNMNPEAAKEAHKLLVENFELYENVIDAAGKYDAKLESTANSSLAAHILNAVTVGVNTFVFNAVGEDETVYEYEEDIKILAAALALHDTNKYIQEAHGVNTDGNTRAAFDRYFNPDKEHLEADPFGIHSFVDEEYRDDLLYLVQRTELTEDSSETRELHSEFAGLERYCRIGDAVASVALKKGIEGAHEKLAEILDEDQVHLLQFTEIEQPLLNDALLGTVKEIIAGELTDEASAHGVVLASSSNSILYLGRSVDEETLYDMTVDWAPTRIENEFEFECKLGWNTFDYDILAEVGIPHEDKEDTIAEAFRSLLKRGPAGVEPFEFIPDDFDQYFPVLAKSIYLDGQSEFDDPAVQDAYDHIRNQQNSQTVKIHFIAYLVQHMDEHRDFLDAHAEKLRPELKQDLEPDSDAIETVVERFFSGRPTADLDTKDAMCFLCGATAERDYKKGNEAIYQTYGYSRRVPPHEEYKSICEVCNLEYALLADICERSGVYTGGDVEVAYFYFDDFLGDIRLRSRRAGNVVQGDRSEMDDTEVTTSLFAPQYYLQPVYIQGDNHRMEMIQEVMQTARNTGMKVVLGRPFTRFEGADAVFVDEEATRPQKLLGLDAAERFGPLPEFADAETDSHLRRGLHLFQLMDAIGGAGDKPNPLLELDRDEFHSIAHFAVNNHDNATNLDMLHSYFERYHNNALMNMQTVAERGIDLFGEQYDSKYKKTKVFREAIDAFLSGMNQRMDNADLLDYVESQVYAAADREDYAGYVTPGEAEAFVEAIRTYLVENDLYDLKKLSDWEDALVNSYYYAYDQALNDQ